MRIFAGLPRNAAIDPLPLLKKLAGGKDEIRDLKDRIKQLEEELNLAYIEVKLAKYQT
ncbi:hypothetical protein U3A58_13850 [Algoriphagus sp. C2-6-M1]|uniref:hypothetical protein n=1 Tax=Algoriphagus persicinus TaxID=3108754 RepID=UPI002B37B1C5|nr:hypothetical protein [Algoriphagus sp. C2-6-M1]MEB2781480.1 hypothetical protein [Algoriphagus sp. C2-6-M1]